MKKSYRNIILLGWVSLFTDLSSQMIYPLIPKFLVGLGAGALLIGLIEGIAEASASFFKPLAGYWSDKTSKRKIWIFGGYSISSLSKPVLALASSWSLVLILRFMDKLGKAVRNPPRDAIISLSAPKNRTGYSFGLQRAYDRIGSIGGPFLALAVLYFFPENLRAVFLFAFIPAIIALIFIPKVKEIIPSKLPPKSTDQISRKNLFRIFILTNILFSLGNSSNAFILLKADEIGFSLTAIPLAWALYNIACAISSPILGKLSDLTGRPFVIMLSFFYYAIIYFAFSQVDSMLGMWLLFVFYGFHYGLSKGIFKAYVSDITVENERGKAYGLFDMWTGISLFLASLLMGFVWEYESSNAGFLIGSIFSLLALMVFWFGQKLSSGNSR